MELWTSSWGPWKDHARQWWEGASEEDRHHVACLRVPQSFLKGIPPEHLPFLRTRVARHQYHMLIGVHALVGKLQVPPRTEPRTFESGSASAWYGKLRHRQVRPNPTDKVLWEQVLYKPQPKKKKAAHAPATPQQIPDKTSLLLARPVTQHTVLHILQTTDSPDYQLSVHTSQRH